MKFELFPFQETARKNLLIALDVARYAQRHGSQIISFTAPTGAGKTIITAAMVESIYLGDEDNPARADAIFVWLSDSPELNAQSKEKFYRNADDFIKAKLVTIDETFNQEILDDGKIYFLNTQKLSKTGNLTRHSDFRQFTIWETLQNTILEKSERLIFIIDEAHRGMKGRLATQATTIMQKFIKGSPEDGLDAAPLIIGMSATIERFNNLARGINSSQHKVEVTVDDVKTSGLLKERIIVVYPDADEKFFVAKDMAMLEAAADDWKDKIIHWQNCAAEVKPIFIVQVQNGSGDKISETDLDECLKKICERTGFNFEVGEVVHTFGGAGDLMINNLRVVYEEPSAISGNENIRAVFFKESLSTGWDCPRAETMMSFRRAVDATYIAQLLGRMIRTPLQRRIESDDTLNDVRLFLPQFDKNSVQLVLDKLQGEDIPADIYSEQFGTKKFEVLTVDAAPKINSSPSIPKENSQPEKILPPDEILTLTPEEISKPKVQPAAQEEFLSRREILNAINAMGLLNYDVRSKRINDYLKSLFNLAHFLTRHLIAPQALDEVRDKTTNFICDCIGELKASGDYDSLKAKAKQFKLSAQTFDVFGKTVRNSVEQNLFTTTDSDIERQFLQAEVKLKGAGIAYAYVNKFCADIDAADDYKIDVILFASSNDFLNRLEKLAQKIFCELNDTYRRKIANAEPSIRREWDKIISDGDEISEHNFYLPATVEFPHDNGGEKFLNHLFADKRGAAYIKLNTWEAGVLKEEQRRKDFICWLRNLERKSWALCLPYKNEAGATHEFYPDLIIIRRDADGFVADVLEPHDSTRRDNFGKAQALAKYAKKNSGVGRLELIRQEKNYFKRVDLSRSEIREKILRASTNNELDNLFDEHGKI